MPPERLQKIIAQAGVASRRKAEELIRQGKVRVNGVIVRELGTRVEPGKDRIDVAGRRVVREPLIYLLMNKPTATVTSRKDPEGRQTVLKLVHGVKQRIFPVGRLDYNTSGALVLTNDGELAQALSHPSARAPRTYRTKLDGVVTEAELDQLRRGVRLDDGPAKATEVRVVGSTDRSTTVLMTIYEGRNHQIHRMAAAVGHRVRKLVRISFAGLTIDGLRPGENRHLTGREVGRLKRDYRSIHRARVRGQRRSSGSEGD